MRNFRWERRGRLGAFGAVVLVGILLTGLLLFPGFRGGLREAFTPLWSAVSSASSALPSMSFLKSRVALVEENRALKQELEEARGSAAAFAALKAEYQTLLREFGRTESEQDRLLASVLVRPPTSLYDTLIIDVGENYGVAVGDIIVAGSVAVGEVRAVYGRSSLVVLFSSPGRETEVLIGEENIRAIAVGIGGGTFEVKIPRGITVLEGASVRMPHISPIVFGSITLVATNPAESFQRVLFRNPVSLSTLSTVFVLRHGSGSL